MLSMVGARPAIHAIDGAVSYALEWNGLKFVFGSDTFPNKWFCKLRPERRSDGSRVRS